jgi:hypothetical protein
VTVTSMMFMTPIPPTSNEIAATAPSSTVNVRLLLVAASRNDDALDDRVVRRRRRHLVAGVEDRLHLGRSRGRRPSAEAGLHRDAAERAVPGQRVLDGGERARSRGRRRRPGRCCPSPDRTPSTV